MNKNNSKDHAIKILQNLRKDDDKVEGVYLSNIYNGISEIIKKENPTLTEDSFIKNSELNKYRRKYIESLLDKEQKYAVLEKEVVDSILNKEMISENSNNTYSSNASKSKIVGQNVADAVAKFGGSWTFILLFIFTLLSWIVINVVFITKKPFDPYPFILLNLMLSCIAALQAPIIMMSQNRQDEKDRIVAENRYQVNLKTELEIRLLHEKINHLITEQWKTLLDIQSIQIDLLEDLQKETNKHMNKKTN